MHRVRSVNTPITSFLSSKEDKISRLESDLERFKKLFEREMINNKFLSEELDKL